ncbi:MAG TPA: pirin-like C-terminal cupin domain-containing protein [Patescibacteria group bacterium]|nr:pirin-like C-terminal cupin domain-containing protein [Patescibacteria group bacterium]
MKRKIVKIDTPPPHEGFLGSEHTARAVIETPYSYSDPFILLMDDELDKTTDEPVGGPHPHAGFETVTLVLDGKMGDASHVFKKGDFQMMTAGSGVIHTETLEGKAKVRILQLWLALPKEQRWATPRVQNMTGVSVPTVSQDGVEIRVYSGSLAGVTSPVQNHTPVIIADFQLQPGATTVQYIPASYNAFLYVTNGSVEIGDEQQVLNNGQVGWLDKTSGDIQSELVLKAGETGARITLYAGEPHGDEIVSYGPFIGDTKDDIARLYNDYRQGKIKHISTLPDSQVMNY